MAQPDLFQDGEAVGSVVPGFDYRADVLGADEQAWMVRALQTLRFSPYEHRGYFGHRQIAAFGRRAPKTAGPDVGEGWPLFLERLIARLGARLAFDPEAFVQVLVNAYAPGAGIGWHRDRPIYGEVLGVSLLAPCVMRLRRRHDAGYDRRNAPLAPGSVYRLSGPAREDWEHSIMPMTVFRYSITFRTLA